MYHTADIYKYILMYVAHQDECMDTNHDTKRRLIRKRRQEYVLLTVGRQQPISQVYGKKSKRGVPQQVQLNSSRSTTKPRSQSIEKTARSHYRQTDRHAPHAPKQEGVGSLNSSR